MDPDLDLEVVVRRVAGDATELLDELRRPRTARYVLLHEPGMEVPAAVRSGLVAAAAAPMAATVSPIPVAAAPRDQAATFATDPHLPSPPSLALGCHRLCLFSTEALASATAGPPDAVHDAAAGLTWLMQRLSQAGWRHVAAPGVALAWSPDARALPVVEGAWSASTVRTMDGAANAGLETHVLWAETRLRPVGLVVDGACLTGSIHNGSQAVVVNVARALQRARAGARVRLAVHRPFVESVRSMVERDGVEVVTRDRHAEAADVVYRPYQLLDPSELEWLARAGARALVGQLDMIAFSNPAYHPSPALFHTVRNLQRHTMRWADGVTFISEFGRQTALAECPDVDTSRCHVVSCGAMSRPDAATGPSPELARPPVAGRFVACASATFWHKNREHAIAVFAAMCDQHGYDGSLVMAGPEPYYGRSTDAEQRLVASLPDDVRRRIVTLGQVDEATKWWLLGAADLVLYPSVVEGFGLVPFEAASVGTPSLSYAGSAIVEVLGSGRASMRTWDVDAWASTAASIVASADVAAEVAAEVDKAASTLTWDDVAARTWSAIDQTLARPRARRHAEEGGPRSRVAAPVGNLSPIARPAHFGNRLVSFVARRGRSVGARLRSNRG